MPESKIKRFLSGFKAWNWWFPQSGPWLSGGGGYGIERVFMNRRTLNLNNPEAWFAAYAQHELAYACINKIADVMNDAEIVIEAKKGDDWTPIENHPLTALFKRPNAFETGKDFRRLMVQSEHTAGIVYIETVPSRAGMPVEFFVLNPNRVTPRTRYEVQRDNGRSLISRGEGFIPDVSGEIIYYEYHCFDGQIRLIKPENMLMRRRTDLMNRFYGLSPIAVALRSINSDLALTDYVDAFFESDGTPSGLLKISNRKLSPEEAEALQSQWKAKYARGGFNHKGPAILDEDADYQTLGSNLDDLDTQNISSRFESRICSVFGVPPILVGSLVGLIHTTTNATMKSALNDFWDNKINPELAQLREWLTWFVLPLFDDIEAIKAGRLRVTWDVSETAFLQEDEDNRHARIRENFKAGLMMLNEAREAIGLMPDESTKGEDYYIQPANMVVISPERRADEAIEDSESMPLQLENGGGGQENNEDTDAEEVSEVSGEDDNEPKTILPVFPVKTVNPLPSDPPAPSAAPIDVAEAKRLSVEFDGMMVRREPNNIETLCDLKAMVNEQEINQSRAEKVLKTFRLKLIEQAVAKLERRTPENAHELRLEPDAKTRKELFKAIRNAYATGQNQVARELLAQRRMLKADSPATDVKDLDDTDLRYIEEITDGLVSRVINEIKTRAINQYLALKLLVNYSRDILERVLLDQSDKYISDLAGSVINAATQSGRTDEANERRDEWDNVQYSAILDDGTCAPCEEADGMEADNPKDLPDAPNPDCEGQARCRCFHIFVAV